MTTSPRDLGRDQVVVVVGTPETMSWALRERSSTYLEHCCSDMAVKCGKETALGLQTSCTSAPLDIPCVERTFSEYYIMHCSNHSLIMRFGNLWFDRLMSELFTMLTVRAASFLRASTCNPWFMMYCINGFKPRPLHCYCSIPDAFPKSLQYDDIALAIGPPSLLCNPVPLIVPNWHLKPASPTLTSVSSYIRYGLSTTRTERTVSAFTCTCALLLATLIDCLSVFAVLTALHSNQSIRSDLLLNLLLCLLSP